MVVIGYDARYIRFLPWQVTDFVARVHARAAAKHAKPLVYVGDLNCAATDDDLSHRDFFREMKMDRIGGGAEPLAAENRGQPGCTTAERTRFGQMVAAGELVDVYRAMLPPGTMPSYTVRDARGRLRDPSVPHSESLLYGGFMWRGGALRDPPGQWRGTPGREVAASGRYYGKGMRIDHLLISRLLLEGSPRVSVLRAEICGRGAARIGFLGSDHCPMLLELAPEDATAAATAAADESATT